MLLTTYGILRNDIDRLGEVPFAVAVFDEIQLVKNPLTVSHRAAQRIDAGTRVGLTGTPVENSLVDLKALLDLVAPGYLGSDATFRARFPDAIESGQGAAASQELHRLVAPFTLRRLKTAVLDELPPKIEDIRTCTLSEDQVKLYRDAVAARGAGLLAALRDDGQPVPYIHVFALLGILKQICDHPALVAGKPETYPQYASGKWELFKELLCQSLDSGQKVVVYSQYLDMIRIIGLELEEMGVDHAVLTGASRDRGAIVARFNEDPGCRVFVGSLGAGGVGTDLVSASVVIHYDRWWNAAREDQATDRVHRIGQKRGVHVFKIVTEGTLEEKIASIIARKRALMESVVKENDPHLLRTFTREELMALIEAPAPARNEGNATASAETLAAADRHCAGARGLRGRAPGAATLG